MQNKAFHFAIKSTQYIVAVGLSISNKLKLEETDVQCGGRNQDGVLDFLKNPFYHSELLLKN